MQENIFLLHFSGEETVFLKNEYDIYVNKSDIISLWSEKCG